MADIRPFRGLRYNTRLSPDLAAVISPPYDVISEDERQQLYLRSPYNIIRLEYGETYADDTAENNRYTRAASALADWRSGQLLVQDAEPAFYLYELEFPYLGRRYRRQALFARVRLVPWEDRIVRPHEGTMEPLKTDRLNLLRACRANISPVFSLYRSRSLYDLSLLFDDAPGLLDFVDAEGSRHVLRAISDPGRQEEVRRALREEPLYIADGHHRYETGLFYMQERKSQAATWSNEEPDNFILMALTAADDPGLLVLPIHRLVQAPVPSDLASRLVSYFVITEMDKSGDAEDSIAERLVQQIAEAGTRAICFGLIRPSEPPLMLTLRDREAVRHLLPEGPDAWRWLDVNVLHYVVLHEVLGLDLERAATEALTFTHDHKELWHEVRSGRYPLGFLLNPVAPQQVLAVADLGLRMPQKSTFFYPKLPTGLVINPLE